MREPTVGTFRTVPSHERLAGLAAAAHHHPAADDAPRHGVEVALLLGVAAALRER